MGRLIMVYRHLKRAFELKNILLVNFLCLLLNLFFLVMQLNQGLWPVETFFQPSMTPKDKGVMLATFKTFISALQAANLTYLIYGGTLIGSYRHHGFIPWDDDVDVMLNFSQKAQVRDALKALEPDYGVYGSDDLTATSQWKFYLTSSDGYMHKSFKWPYIDIFFFKENASHIWDATPIFSKDYCWEKSTVFPLIARPFEDMWVQSPCDSGGVLQKNYKLNLCRSRQFSHMSELPLFTFNTKDVPCKRLEHITPFVQRTINADGSSTEMLKVAGYSLQNYTLGTCKIPPTAD